MKNYLYLLLLILCTVSCKKNDYGFNEWNVISVNDTSLNQTTALPVITLAFENPRIINGKYTVDVAAISSEPKEVFGINVRFLFQAKDFTNNVVFKNFNGGYGLTAIGQPKPNTGNAASYVICGFDGAATYVNGAIQLNVQDSSTAIVLDTIIYRKIFEIELTPKYGIDIECTPLVWEKMHDPTKGGFIGGSAGVVITTVKGIGLSSPSIATPSSLNWVHLLPQVKGKYPYGETLNCN